MPLAKRDCFYLFFVGAGGLITARVFKKGFDMDVMQMIQAFGFPVASCCAMAWYVKYITDQNNARIDQMNKEHREEVNRLSSVLENNTLAIQKLTDYITLGHDDGR